MNSLFFRVSRWLMAFGLTYCYGFQVFAQSELSIRWEAEVSESDAAYEVKLRFAKRNGAFEQEGMQGWILTSRIFRQDAPNQILNLNAFDLSTEAFEQEGDTVRRWAFKAPKTISSATVLELVLQHEETGRTESREFTLGAVAAGAEQAFRMEKITQKEELPFVRQSDSVVFFSSKPYVYVYRFEENFTTPLPPFSTAQPQPRGLDIAEVRRVPTGQPLAFRQLALYLAVEDSLDEAGISFRVVTNDFPKYRVINHLATALIYITTAEEYQKVNESDQKKRQIEALWLSFEKQAQAVKRNIQEYYDRVAYANRYFTSVKEGWKTDRGMIYIVFGPPVEVNELYDKIQWSYFTDDKKRRLVFTFQKKETALSDNHYLLTNRAASYKSYWMDAIEKWRNPGR